MALLAANSSLHDAYERFRHLPLGFSAGAVALEHPLEWWVNDALMAVFFLLVALEIWAAQRFGWTRQGAPSAPVEPSPCSAHRA